MGKEDDLLRTLHSWLATIKLNALLPGCLKMFTFCNSDSQNGKATQTLPPTLPRPLSPSNSEALVTLLPHSVSHCGDGLVGVDMELPAVRESGRRAPSLQPCTVCTAELFSSGPAGTACFSDHL